MNDYERIEDTIHNLAPDPNELACDQASRQKVIARAEVLAKTTCPWILFRALADVLSTCGGPHPSRYTPAMTLGRRVGLKVRGGVPLPMYPKNYPLA